MKPLTSAACAPMTSSQWLSHNAQQYDIESAKGFAFDFAGARYLLARWMTLETGDTQIDVAESAEDRDSWFPTSSLDKDGVIVPADDPTAGLPKTYWLISRDKIEPLL